MIQDAAVKCRYCGEWLDPSKRPPHSVSWSPSGPSASDASVGVSAAEQPLVAPAAPEDSSLSPANSLADDASAEPGAESSSRWAPPPSILSGTYERGGVAEDSGVIAPGSARQRTPASGSLSLSAVSAELSTELSPADAEEGSNPASHLRLAPEPAPGQPAEDRDSAKVDDLSARVPTDGTPGQDYEALVSFVAQHSGADTGAWTAEPTEEPGTSAEALAIADEKTPQPGAPAAADAAPSQPASTASEARSSHEPAPASAAPTGPTSPTSALEAEFLGSGDSFGAGDSFGFGDYEDDDGDYDYGDDGDPFGGNVSAAPRRVPWTAILGGAVLVVAVFFVFAKLGEFSRGDGAADSKTADAKVDAKVDTKADAKSGAATPSEAPPSELAKAAGEGQPVVPADGKAPDAKTPEVTPDSKAPDAVAPDAKTPPAAPPVEDAAFKEKLAEARSLYERHKLKAAGEALDALKGAESNHPDVLLLTAQVLLEREKFDDAMSAAKRCVELSSTQADCWLTLGVLQQNAKEKEAAIAAYEKYLNLAPSGRYVRDASSQLKRLRGK